MIEIVLVGGFNLRKVMWIIILLVALSNMITDRIRIVFADDSESISAQFSDTMKGVLDRIEGNLAVILIEARKEEVVVPMCELPAGSEEGTWFTIEMIDEEFEIVENDERTTKEKRARVKGLLDRLRFQR